MTVFPFLPLGVIALLVLAAAGILWRVRSRRPAFLSSARHRLLLAFRVAVWLAVLALLLNPGRVREDRHADRSQIAFLVDRSASMATRDMPYQTARLAAAGRFLTDHPLKRLADYPQPLFPFNTTCGILSNRADLATLAPEGGTDLRRAVGEVERTVGFNRVAALVLLSDGIDPSGFSESESQIPLFCVRFGCDLSESRDVAVRPFDLPEKVAVNERVTVDVPLLLNGYPEAREVTFEAKVDGTVRHSATLTLTRGRPHTEPFAFTVTEPGIHLVEVACGALEDEVSLLNNRRIAAIEAVEAKAALFAYFPVLNTSFRPLLREFTKADAPPFTALCKMADRQYALKGREPDLRFKEGLPEKAEALKSFSAVIVGGHSRDVLTPAETFLLEQYVRGGGTLICLAGAESYGKLDPRSPMARMLPVIPPETPDLHSGRFAVRIGEGAHGGFAEQMRLLLAANEGDEAFALASLNAVKGVKTQAEVLLSAEGEERFPLLVAQPYGQGKVIALLSNSLHQWGKPERREANHSAFWRQLVAYAGAGEEASEWLTPHLPRKVFETGEPVELQAEVRRPESLPAQTPLRVEARIVAMGENRVLSRLTLEEKGTRFSATFPGFEKAGRYRVELSLLAGDECLRTRYALLLVGEDWREGIALDSSPERFRRICSDRHLFGSDDAEGLENALLAVVRKKIQTTEERILFGHWGVCATLLALLLAEWLFRRLSNLV